jgi:LuxR family quorum-sensing system transcriptional regulator SolR
MAEHSWWSDLFAEIDVATNRQQVVDQICCAADQLGFDYWAYGARPLLPSRPGEVEVLNSYPAEWMAHYHAEQFLEIDTSVSLAAQRATTITWKAAKEMGGDKLWSDAADFGLNVGVAHPSWNRTGSFGLLTLARRKGPLSAEEQRVVAPQLAWLSPLIHGKLSSLKPAKQQGVHQLSSREIEILRWTALGKTAAEVASIFGITTRTVNFHVANILVKLDAQNKIQAAVRATILGML